MIKLNFVLYTAILCSFASSSHPFVGEHSNASDFEYEDGGFALRMTKQKAVVLNKYSTLIDRTKSYGQP